MRDKRTHYGLPGDSAGRAFFDSAFDPAERSARARLAAWAMHARNDASETTRNARTSFLARFERQVDPDGLLTPAERQRRAMHARRLYFARLSRAGVKARRAHRAREGGDAA